MRLQLTEPLLYAHEGRAEGKHSWTAKANDAVFSTNMHGLNAYLARLQLHHELTAQQGRQRIILLWNRSRCCLRDCRRQHGPNVAHMQDMAGCIADCMPRPYVDMPLQTLL